MDEWRRYLRSAVAEWKLAPEEQEGIIDELEEHLEQELAELTPRIGAAAARERIMAQVRDPALRDARIRSRRQPVVSVQASREIGRGWHAVVRDFGYGWRSLRTNLGTTAISAIALALGIGLTTVMFTIIYGLLVRGLPYDAGDRIAMVMETNPSRGEEELSLSMHDFITYRGGQKSFETFGAWMPTTVNLAGDEQPERVDAARVTAAALEVPRVRPLFGRTLRADDEVAGGPLVTVLSYSLWRDRYAGDSAILGRVVRINGRPATVVGVMPEGFGFPRETRIWLPLQLDPSSAPWGAGPHLNGVGRLRPGSTSQQANADLATIAKRIETDHGETNAGVRPMVQPFIRATIPRRVNGLLYAMFGAVALVFLVACTNVANLLLGRAAHRSKEVAIRVALGASRAAIARQFLVEAFLLSLAAAALGALVAKLGLAAFQRGLAGELPFWADFRLHPQVFLFIAVTALLASVLAGLLPALTASRTNVTDVLKDYALGSSSLRAGRLTRWLVVVQLGLSSTLLIVAALATKSVMNLRSIEPGFVTHGVMTGRVTLAERDSGKATAFFENLEREISRFPGATGTALSTSLPATGWEQSRVAVEGRSYRDSRSYPSVRRLAVTPGFFTTFGVPILRGRAIRDEDRAGTLPVAVVNQRVADRLFQGADPIGHRINLAPADSSAQWATVVGIMPNLYATDQLSVVLGTPWPSEILTAFRQRPRTSASIAIRTDGESAAIARPLRALVASIDRDLPVYAVTSMDDALAGSRREVRVFGSLFIVFGIVSLTLASIGLYAVMAFSVSRREREMGIRLALGASAANILRLVLRDGVMQLVLGTSIGVLLGVSAARLAGAVLFEVRPSDPAIITVVVATLCATGLVACGAPALRATRADPVRSMKAE